MGSERNKIRRLYTKLVAQPRIKFPAPRQPLDAPKEHGVYIIMKGRSIFHVGRTTRAKDGLHQRLTGHLNGRSSFTKTNFNRDGSKLRSGYLNIGMLSEDSVNYKTIFQVLSDHYGSVYLVVITPDVSYEAYANDINSLLNGLEYDGERD